jgi:hypothetical protein
MTTRTTLDPLEAATIAAAVRAPEHLWLFEAVVRLRLETGCSHEFAVAEFQHLYPTINVQATLERTVAELMRIMQPVYDAKVAVGWVPAVRNGNEAR